MPGPAPRFVERYEVRRTFQPRLRHTVPFRLGLQRQRNRPTTDRPLIPSFHPSATDSLAGNGPGMGGLLCRGFPPPFSPATMPRQGVAGRETEPARRSTCLVLRAADRRAATTCTKSAVLRFRSPASVGDACVGRQSARFAPGHERTRQSNVCTPGVHTNCPTSAWCPDGLIVDCDAVTAVSARLWSAGADLHRRRRSGHDSLG